MTPETMIGLVLTVMVAAIGYFMKSLISEARSTRETMLTMHTAFISVQADVKDQHKQILNIIERLVRLEERQAR